MKKFFLFLIVAISIVAAAAQTKARVSFAEKVWDFGTINEVDGDVSHTFKFRNEGKTPFVINSVGVSCGCTTPRFSKEPIREGGEGVIQVIFDPTNRPGPFEKSINILSNNESGSITLTIKGNVVSRPRTIQDDYPFSISDGVRVVVKSQVIGPLARGRATTHTIGIANGGTKSAQVAIDGSKLPPYVKAVPLKPTLAAGERSEIVLTIDPPLQDDMWGKRRYAFPLVVNGVKYPEDIEVVATLVEDFSALLPAQLRSAPIGEYSSYFYHFSDQPAGKTLTREFKITNNGADPLMIRNFDPSSSRVTTKIDRRTIAKGETATLTITLDTKGAEGRLSESVMVVTNDPVRPTREIRLLANIQ